MEKICIFDLDGTLWKVNSHLDIVNKYYSYNGFVISFNRIWCALFYSSFMNHLNLLFEKIPCSYKENYNPPFRTDGENLLKKAKNEYDSVLVISTAPEEILNNVKKRVDIPVIQSLAGKKYETLKSYIKGDIGYLCAVTDNLSDRDLIEHADRVIIYSNKRREKKFRKFSLPENTVFKDWKLD